MEKEDLIKNLNRLLFKKRVLWIFLICSNLIQFILMVNVWNSLRRDLDNQRSKVENFERMNDSLISEVKSIQPIIQNFPISAPVKGYQISSLYGFRVDPIDSSVRFHGGVDMVNLTDNDTIYSTASGKVIKSEYHPEFGNMVLISHKSGFSTLYGHMSKIIVDNNQKIKTLQAIGIMGQTGRSTGIHLHYEILFNESRINPRFLVVN